MAERPCPFCGGNDIRWGVVAPGLQSALCYECSTDFTFKTHKKAEALKLWNAKPYIEKIVHENPSSRKKANED